MTPANTTIAIWCEWINIIPIFWGSDWQTFFGVPQNFSQLFTRATRWERLTTWLQSAGRPYRCASVPCCRPSPQQPCYQSSGRDGSLTWSSQSILLLGRGSPDGGFADNKMIPHYAFYRPQQIYLYIQSLSVPLSPSLSVPYFEVRFLAEPSDIVHT